MLGGGNIRRDPVPLERQLYGGEFNIDRRLVAEQRMFCVYAAA